MAKSLQPVSQALPQASVDRAQRIARLGMNDFHVPPDQDYAISLFSPGDALGVARLTCSVYADQHPFDYVYDPAEIARLFASGSQFAIVAKSGRGDVLGMIGLYRCAPWPPLFELAQLMILTNQRGQGMARDLFATAMDILPPLARARGIFGEAVCTHLFSQKMCLVTGMTPSGISLEAIPAKAYCGGGGATGRTTLLLHAKPLTRGRRVLAMPEAYREAFATFCGNAGLTRDIRDPAGSVLPARSRTQVHHYPQAGFARIWVHRCGTDLAGLAAACEAKAGPEGTVQAAFDLSGGGVLQGINALRARGYYFAGFLPQWFGADGLLLQRRRLPPSFAGINVINENPGYLINLAERDAAAAGASAWGDPGD